MKLLLDANLSPRLRSLLRDSGHDATHVADVGLLTADDGAIFDYAAEHGLVVVTGDTDFPMLLALRRSTSPSVVLLRDLAALAPAQQAALLATNLAAVSDELERGAVVSLSPRSLRWRSLPIR